MPKSLPLTSVNFSKKFSGEFSKREISAKNVGKLFSILFLLFLLDSRYLECVAEDSLHSATNKLSVPTTVWWRSRSPRVPRSPFMPPMVTSYQPPIRTSRKTKPEVGSSKVHKTRDSITPPLITSHTIVGSRDDDDTKESGVEDVRRRQMIPSRNSDGEGLKHPMAVLFAKSRLSKEEEDPKGVSIVPQNDQYSSVAEEDGGYLPVHEADRFGARGKSGRKEDSKSTKVHDDDDSDRHSGPENSAQSHYYDFHEILELIDLTAGEFEKLLIKRHRTLDDYLGFIKKGVTLEEVKEYLGKGESGRFDDRSYFKGYKNDKVRYDVKKEVKNNDLNRQKLLVDLPFTEIVHEVPVTGRKPYRVPVTSSSLNEHLNSENTRFNEDYRAGKDKKSKNKKYYKKQKSKNHRSSDENPFLMDSNPSSALPHNDSPIITSFLPPKKKDRTEKGSASIISLTIEKKMTNKTESETPSADKFPIRNKVVEKVETDHVSPKSEKIGDINHYDKNDRHRLVFPMKGILIFCGVLGAVAFITIITIIIYGAVKCNRKPLSNSYQLNEHIEIPSS